MFIILHCLFLRLPCCHWYNFLTISVCLAEDIVLLFSPYHPLLFDRLPAYTVISKQYSKHHSLCWLLKFLPSDTSLSLLLMLTQMYTSWTSITSQVKLQQKQCLLLTQQHERSSLCAHLIIYTFPWGCCQIVLLFPLFWGTSLQLHFSPNSSWEAMHQQDGPC